MAETSVLTDVDGPVATVAINRPEKRNALNAAVRRELIEAFDRLRANAEVRVVILTGSGDKAFVAGADIGEFEGRSPIEQFQVMREPTVFDAVADFPRPVIAAINGFCLGGGLELAMACDLRIAADTARLGQPEVGLGIIPGGGGTQRLPRLVGPGAALKLLYTGDLIDAGEALRIGLVEEVVPAAELLPRARALAQAMAQRSPLAQQLIKEAVRASYRTPLESGLGIESTLFGIAFASQDKQEGVRAFLEKRTPNFPGR